MSGFYHSFVTNDPVLIKLGAGTFTKDSLQNKLANWTADDIGDEAFFQYWPNPTVDDLFGNANTGNWTASQFNKSSSSYSSVSKTWGEISSLIDQFEKRADILSIQHADKDTASAQRRAAKDWLDSNINYIKHGSERCFVLYGPIFYDGTKKVDIVTKLFFNIPGAGVDHQKRVVAQKGNNVIAAVAQTPTGLKYSRVKTDNARAEQHAGLYIRPDNMVDGTTGDLATGKLRMSYNDSLGMWESTQTILARLLTPLDGAKNVKFQIPDEDSKGYLKKDSDSEKFYQKTSDYYSGSFTTGVAAPVSMQDGNPHLFGPNIIIEHNEKRIEKIRVVNRSEKSFTQGTLVMCTLIGSEWIVQEFSNLSDQNFPTKVGSWTFSKLIANSDAFFRDANSSDFIWSISDYESKARSAWYASWQSSSPSVLSIHNVGYIARNNGAGGASDFNPSLGYYSASSFDFTGSDYGGKSNGTSIPCIYGNIDKALSITQGYLFGTDFGPAWGPFFPDGYVAAGPRRSSGTGVPYGQNAKQYFNGGSVSIDATSANNLIADIATNGPYDENHTSGPILPIDYWQQLLSGGGSFYETCKTYRQNVYNFPTYLGGGTGPGNAMYGWSPSNPNRIHFSPLSAEMVAHTDKYAPWARDDRADMYSYFRAKYPPPAGDTVFDPIFDRFRQIATLSGNQGGVDGCGTLAIITGQCNGGSSIPSVDLCSIYTPQVTTVGGGPCEGGLLAIITNTCDKEPGTEVSTGIDPQYDPSTMLEYGCYVVNSPLCVPNGTMRGIDEPFVMVGIIAGINRFSRVGGGSVNIETNQYFGIKPNRQVTGSSGSLSILPIGLGTVVGSSAPSLFEYSYPQYGSPTDNYNACGTTALHCRIFDAWPREDTIWDTRYFCALHFNPSYPKDGEDNTSVDFQVPTLSDGTIPAAGATVDSNSNYKDIEDWYWDYIRRGKLLTGGGFTYHKRTIGLDFNSVVIAKAGSDLEDLGASNLEITLPQNNVVCSAIVTGGQLTGVVCTSRDAEGNLQSGENFDAADFKDVYVDDDGVTHTGYVLYFNNAVAIIQGIVRDIVQTDTGPKDHGGPKRLTDGSSGGDDVVEGNKTSEFNLEPNDSGEYDAFFFFHNDVTHTALFAYPGSQVPGFYQYVIASIS